MNFIGHRGIRVAFVAISLAAGMPRIDAQALQRDPTFSPLFTSHRGGAAFLAQPDGRVIAADGSVDPSYAPDLAAGGYPQVLYAEADGSVLVGGDFDAVNGEPRFRLARFRADGSLDPAFLPPTRNGVLAIDDLRRAPDGSGYLVMERTANPSLSSPQTGRWLRLGFDGALLPWQLGVTFDANAHVPQMEASGSFLVPAITGEPASGGGTRLILSLTRYAPGSTTPTVLPTTFADGFWSTPSGYYRTVPLNVTPLQDGTILIGGATLTRNGAVVVGANRINADGSITDPNTAPSTPVMAPRATDRYRFSWSYRNGVGEHVLQRLTTSGGVDATFAGPTFGAGESVEVLAVDSAGGVLIRVDDTLLRYTAEGALDGNAVFRDVAGPATIMSDGVVYGTVPAAASSTGRTLARWIPAEVSAITYQPTDVTAVSGATVEFAVAVGRSGPATYQWSANGVALPGATNRALQVDATLARSGGQYSAQVTVGGQTFTSRPATLTVTRSSGRLANMSARAVAGTGEGAAEIMGFYLGNAAPQPLLVRAVGPTLATFGVENALIDPNLAVFDGAGALLAANAGWGGSDALANAAAQFGAFALPATSADAAVYRSFASGAYTAQVKGTGSGIALCELYAGESTELQNVSVRATLATGSKTPILGFVISGQEPRRVLIRAIGPSLRRFGVTDAAAAVGLQVVSNGGYSGVPLSYPVASAETISPEAADAAVDAGAFAPTAGTGDAAVVLSLMPATYTAQLVIPAGAQLGGIALLELYVLPQ